MCTSHTYWCILKAVQGVDGCVAVLSYHSQGQPEVACFVVLHLYDRSSGLPVVHIDAPGVLMMVKMLLYAFCSHPTCLLL